MLQDKMLEQFRTFYLIFQFFAGTLMKKWFGKWLIQYYRSSCSTQVCQLKTFDPRISISFSKSKTSHLFCHEVGQEIILEANLSIFAAIQQSQKFVLQILLCLCSHAMWFMQLDFFYVPLVNLFFIILLM